MTEPTTAELVGFIRAWADGDGTKWADDLLEAADRLESQQARIAELEGDVERLAGEVRLVYSAPASTYLLLPTGFDFNDGPSALAELRGITTELNAAREAR